MKKLISAILIGILFSLSANAFAAKRYGEANYCGDEHMYCYRVKSGDSWEKLFPNEEQRDVVMRLNRINIRLHPGLRIAIPKDLENTDLFAVSPFELRIDPPQQNQIIVDLNKLAWGAYDRDGNLVFWGPASGGKDFCPDIGKGCHTTTGNFRIQRKQYAGCISSVFPIEWEGGAPMPFCMHFNGGYALHGSYDVPGYNASHGCIRMFINDARWLNENFAKVGTRVIVLPYGDNSKENGDNFNIHLD